MDIGNLSDISKEAIYVLISVSAPILLIALTVGVVISLLQALTQIQENTLTFVPKILVIYLSLLFLVPLMLNRLQTFMQNIVDQIIMPGG